MIKPPEQSRVISPCNGVCQIGGETGLCLGCLRTMEEITKWRALDDEARLNILEKVEQRKAS